MKKKAFTLVEIIVALATSLILMLGVLTVIIFSNQVLLLSHVDTENQENMRRLTEMIRSNVKSAQTVYMLTEEEFEKDLDLKWNYIGMKKTEDGDTEVAIYFAQEEDESGHIEPHKKSVFLKSTKHLDYDIEFNFGTEIDYTENPEKKEKEDLLQSDLVLNKLNLNLKSFDPRLLKEDLTEEDLPTEDLAEEDLPTEDLTEEDLTEEDLTEEDLTEEDLKEKALIEKINIDIISNYGRDINSLNEKIISEEKWVAVAFTNYKEEDIVHDQEIGIFMQADQSMFTETFTNANSQEISHAQIGRDIFERLMVNLELSNIKVSYSEFGTGELRSSSFGMYDEFINKPKASTVLAQKALDGKILLQDGFKYRAIGSNLGNMIMAAEHSVAYLNHKKYNILIFNEYQTVYTLQNKTSFMYDPIVDGTVARIYYPVGDFPYAHSYIESLSYASGIAEELGISKGIPKYQNIIDTERVFKGNGIYEYTNPKDGAYDGNSKPNQYARSQASRYFSKVNGNEEVETFIISIGDRESSIIDMVSSNLGLYSNKPNIAVNKIGMNDFVDSSNYYNKEILNIKIKELADYIIKSGKTIQGSKPGEE